MTIKYIELTSTATEPENIIPTPSDSDIKNTFGKYDSFVRLFSTKNIFKLVRPKGTSIVKLYKKQFDQNKRQAYQKLKELTDEKNKNQNLLKLKSTGELPNGCTYEECEYIENIIEILADKAFVKDNIRIFIEQISTAINTLHKKNILHLDVKPSNCFLISKDPIHFLLSDYGTIVLLDEDQELYETKHAGTLQFRAPECDSESGTYKVTKAADYYSLGMTIQTIVHKNRFEFLDEKDILYFKQVTKVPSIDENEPSLRNINILLKGLQGDLKDKRWDYETIIDWLNDNITHYNNDSGIINSTNDLIYNNLKNAVLKANQGDIFHCKKGEYDDRTVVFDKDMIIKGIQDRSVNNIFNELIIQSKVKFQYMCFHGQNFGESRESLFTVEKNAILSIENSTIESKKTVLLLSKPGAKISLTNNKKIEVEIGLFLKNSTLTVNNSEIVAKIGPAIVATDNSEVILKDARIKSKHKSVPPILLKNNSKITIDDKTVIKSEYGEYLAKDDTSKSVFSNEEINEKTIIYEDIV